MVRPKYRWQWGLVLDPRINFAVRVIAEDGLRVPPLALHKQHRGPLQQLGMTSQQWMDWLNALTSQRFGDPTIDPSLLWPGSARVGDALSGLWIAYEPIAVGWASFVDRSLPAKRELRMPGRDMFSEDEIRAISGEVPALRVIFVEYVAQVVLPQRPNSLVIGGEPEAMTLDAFTTLVRRGLDLLG